MTKGLSVPLSHSPAAGRPPPSPVPPAAPSSPAPVAPAGGGDKDSDHVTASRLPVASGSPRWSGEGLPGRKSSGRKSSQPPASSPRASPATPRPRDAHGKGDDVWKRGPLHDPATYPLGQAPPRPQHLPPSTSQGCPRDARFSPATQPSRSRVGRTDSDPTRVQSPSAQPLSRPAPLRPAPARGHHAPQRLLRPRWPRGGLKGTPPEHGRVQAGRSSRSAASHRLLARCNHLKPRAGRLLPPLPSPHLYAEAARWAASVSHRPSARVRGTDVSPRQGSPFRPAFLQPLVLHKTNTPGKLPSWARQLCC